MGLATVTTTIGGDSAAIAPSQSFNFIGASSLDPLITFTRASSATYVNSAGLVATAGNNVARFDYNPSTLASLGLLIEEQRINICLWGSDLTNAAWTATNCTTAMTATGPDGAANSATTVTAIADNATILQAITSASAARITSCWVKRRTGVGAISMTQDNGGTWTAVTVTAAWTRVNIASATLVNPTVGLRISVNGDAVDVALFQNEAGAFITSAIATTNAPVTRAADTATITGSNFTGFYNASEGTIFISGDTVNANGFLGSVLDGTAANRMNIALGTSCVGLIIASSSTTFNQGISGLPLGSIVSGALAYKANNANMAANGQIGATDTSVTIPTVNRMAIGSNGLGTFLDGHVRSVVYYNKRMANAQLQAISLG